MTMKPMTLVAILSCVGRAQALGVLDSGLSQVYGSNKYVATSGFVTIGQEEGFYFEPSFSSYHSADTPATDTYSGRLGYDSGWLNLGLEGAATPKVNNYRSYSVGGDVTFSPSLGGEDSPSSGSASEDRPRKGLARVDIGAGATFTNHFENLPRLGPLRPARIQRTGQTDLSLSGGAKVLFLDLSGQYVRSFYDRGIPSRPRAALRAQARGANPAVFGFPDMSANAKLTLSILPLISPFLGFAYTQYKVDQPAARSYRAGASISAKLVSVTAYYELYDAGGGSPKQSYYSLGGTLKF